MPVFPYKGVRPVIAENVFIAPGAMVIGNVTIQAGASIWYNVVIRADSAPIVIGSRTNIQDNCTLHVDADAPLVIGEACTIGHNAVVHGATLGDHVLIGMNAVILSHAHIGSRTIIGACALVSEHKSLPEGILAVGIPAKVIRALHQEELRHLEISAEEYAQRAQEHIRGLEGTMWYDGEDYLSKG
jgi:carbonic anhydrase/acetyltransferase-like protein (isoleucine patch superfamily)